MSIRLSCPSCNTSFALAATPPDRRVTCPRCGDVFPVRGSAAEETGVRGEETADRKPETESRGQEVRQPANRGLSARRAALGAMVLGVLGFAVGLTVYYTREPKPAPPALTPEGAATPPARLVGLGYLPAECNVVFAIQPGPLLAFATRSQQDPRELLGRAGVPDQVFGALDSIGLSLPQIDHLAGGLYLPDPGDGELRVALVLVLKQPLADENEFLKKLRTKPVEGKPGHWTAEFAGVQITPVLARVAPTVWVLGLNDRDLAAVARGGFGPGGTQFRGSDAEGLRRMLSSVPPEAAIWIAADDDRDWTQKPLLKSLAGWPQAEKSVPALGRVLGGASSGGRGGAFALSYKDEPRVRLFVRTAEPATAERVRAYFQARAAEMGSATAGGGGTLALFEGPFDPGTLRRFLADAAK